HIVLSILAYSLLTIGATQAIILAIQEHLLKKHALKGLFQYLPPLQTMDKLLFEIILYGFVFLTLSIISGFFFLDNMFSKHFIHKTVISLLAWAIFALLIGGHTAYGWRGITAAKLTLFGFAFLMLAYFGSKFALEIILQRQ
ncbi:MAG: cytochrome c biogenesis protein CcsA, partial [Cellvibrionales bacterium]|nr:cytochrome c biogenesis protein CcsA [Cellvibrionales bacterium]